MSDQTKYTQKLKGANVLVIGGSAGIGYGVAEALLEHGAHVTISSSQTSRVDSAVSSLQKSYPSAAQRVQGYAYSMGDAATLDSNIKELLEKSTSSKKLDHIVFTAGDSLATLKLTELSIENVTKAGMVRYYAPLMLAKHAPAYMNSGPEASIVLTTGSVSQKPIPGWSVVNGFATALHGLTRGLALDLKPLRVNLVSPGMVVTPMWDSVPKEVREERFKHAESEASTTGRVGQVEDVVQAFLYCIKDRNVTGTVISSNSGALLT